MKVSVAIPATTNGAGEILYATLSYRNAGQGSLYLDNVFDVTEMNKAAIRNARTAAVSVAATGFFKDVIIEIIPRRQSLIGRSWELPLSLGFCSLLTGIELRQNMTASGVLSEPRKMSDYAPVLPVASLSEKVQAAKEAGLNSFLISSQQPYADTPTMEVIRVRDIKEAWQLAQAEKWRINAVAK